MDDTHIFKCSYSQDPTNPSVAQESIIFVTCDLARRYVSGVEKFQTVNPTLNISEVALSYWKSYGAESGGVASIEEIQINHLILEDAKNIQVVCAFDAPLEPLLKVETLQNPCTDTKTAIHDFAQDSRLRASLMSFLETEVWQILDNLSRKNVLLFAGGIVVPLQEFIGSLSILESGESLSGTGQLGCDESTPFRRSKLSSESSHYTYSSSGWSDEEMANSQDGTRFGTYPPRRKYSRPRGLSEDSSAVPRTMPDYKPMQAPNRHNGRAVLPYDWRS